MWDDPGLQWNTAIISQAIGHTDIERNLGPLILANDGIKAWATRSSNFLLGRREMNHICPFYNAVRLAS